MILIDCVSIYPSLIRCLSICGKGAEIIFIKRFFEVLLYIKVHIPVVLTFDPREYQKIHRLVVVIAVVVFAYKYINLAIIEYMLINFDYF